MQDVVQDYHGQNEMIFNYWNGKRMTREWPDKFRRKLTDNKSASACPGSEEKLRTLSSEDCTDHCACRIIRQEFERIWDAAGLFS